MTVTIPGVNVQITVGNDVATMNGGYSLQMNAYGQMNANGSPITSITVNGPHILTSTMTPEGSSAGWYYLTVSPSQPPQVGDVYTFLVSYADGSQTTQTASVQGVVTVAPTLTVTQPAGGGLSFTWTDVSAQVPNASYYDLYVYNQNGGYIWGNNYPLSTLSGAFNDNGYASQQLQQGETYTCSLYIYDQFGDYAFTSVSVTIPGVTVSLTVGNNVDPVNGGYSVQMNAYGQMNANGSPITSITVSGPHIPTTPMTSDESSDGYYSLTVYPSQPPQVGDLYTFLVSYADGTQTTRTASVQGVVTVAPSLTVTQPAGGGLTFTWTDVSSQVPNASYYWLSVTDQYGEFIWQRSYPLSTLSGAFNDNGNAWQQLQKGGTYTCCLYIYDQFGDFAYTTVTVTIPGHEPATLGVTVFTSVGTVNDYYIVLSAQGVAIASVTVTGPNIPQTTLSTNDPADGFFWSETWSSQTPQIGDKYTYVVTYTDGTQATQTTAVQGVITVAPTLTVT